MMETRVRLPVVESGSCRCGLCCVMPSIDALEKVSGVQCQSLQVEGDKSIVTSCNSYEVRPTECRSFDCSISDEYLRMRNLLDVHILGILEGNNVNDGTVNSVSQSWVLKHSAVTQALRTETRVGYEQQRAINALILPNKPPMQDQVSVDLLRNFGVTDYLRSISADEAMQMLLWTQHKMEGSFLMSGSIAEWNRVGYLMEVGVGLNSLIREGADMFIRGEGFHKSFPENKDRIESQISPKFLRRPSSIMERIVKESVGI